VKPGAGLIGRLRLRWKRMRTRVRWLGAITVLLVAGTLWVRLGPLPDGLLEEPSTPSTIVLDRHGEVLYEARAGDGTRTIKLTAETLPPVLVAATLAAEDRRFWSHPGVDPIAIVRAARVNLAERSVVEGGSTISQQVAKLLLTRQDPSRRRGWTAKLHEAVVALRLEHRLTKREVLALYLNLAAYGNQITGVERASRAYFDRPAAMLTPAQAAFLAGLPQRPSGFNPYRNRDAALSRQRLVLRRMETSGALSAEDARQSRDERLDFAARWTTFIAPHFVQMVLASSGTGRPERIVTTLDAGLQADIAGVIESHRPMLQRHGAGNVAVVVLDNATGEWLAWEGSGDYDDPARGGTINGASAPRQPGSALKPFTYALAFERGHSPASVLADIPSSFPTAAEGVVYSPRNYDGRFRGPLLARAALAGSENVPAVALASEIGVANLLRFLGRAGLTTLDKTSAHYGLGLTLGNAEVRLDELVSAYAAFARGGEWLEPRVTRAPPTRSSRRIVSPRTAFWITDILSDPDAREYAFGRGGSLEFPFPVAVKTGTSQAYHDNWTVGYSKHVTVGVWVGNFDRKPLRNSSGVTGAAPVFQGVMLAAERRASGTVAAGSELPRPTHDTKAEEICALSGMAANAWCPNRRREWLPAEREALPCSWHHHADEGLVTILPADYQAWSGAWHVRAASVSEPKPAQVPQTRTKAAPLFAIANPADGATYMIDPTLRREFQTLPLRAVSDTGGEIAWTINGRPAGMSLPGRALEWPLAVGRHRIAARDPRGRMAEATITVR
jgi:penicillin-binding protein 1C